MPKELKMSFDPNTIEHLGIQMYSTLPPVIAELVANCYDADAKNVFIFLNDQRTKEITIQDNGHGMCFDELNAKFLMIGRNRREDEQSDTTPSGRKVIGKKGIGKLSFFGIASAIEVITVKEGIKNSFRMKWDDIRSSGKAKRDYKPEIVILDSKTKESSGTIIKLLELNRKTPFRPDAIGYSLSRYFTIFNKTDFQVKIIHNDDKISPFEIKDELKYQNLDEEVSWNFPSSSLPFKYEFADQITGKIISAKDVVVNSMNGIALFSRGKLVNDHSFYDVNTSSQGYSYISGWLNIDFIDDWDKEVISTNRRSLHWEDPDAMILKDYLNQVIRYFFNEAKEIRAANKIKEIEDVSGIQIIEWIEKLPKPDRKLANKLVKSILNSEGINTSKATEMILYVKDSFQLESFQEIAADLDETFLNQPDKIIEFFNTWKLIEAREMYKISNVRIQTIKKFQMHIEKDSREVPELHNFLKQFPWLLDPRIMNFDDEVTYSQLLKDNFKELEKKEEDKRIDFLCVGFSESFFIIELKRPSKVIGEKELLQANKYVSFIRERLGNEYGKNVCCYIIGKKLSPKDNVKTLSESFKKNNVVYVKPFEELLSNARRYHQEFIEKYETFE